MKKSKLILCFMITAIVTLCAALITGCGNGLSRPGNLVLDMATYELTWSPVENATYYNVEINGRSYVSSKASYSLSTLSEGDYTLRIKAKDAGGKYGDSAWSESLSFTKEYESGIQYRLTNANTEYTVYKVGTAKGDVVIEDTYRGLPVTSISNRAFYASGAVTGITIGKNIKTIGSFAFTNCSNMTSITIPDNVESIGESAFQGCRGLSEIVLPAGITEIAESTFRYCRNLERVNLPSTVTTIGSNAFCDCDKLERVALPDSVLTIGDSAFSGCDLLKEFNLGVNTHTIGDSAFYNCRALTTVQGGSSLKEIATNAFRSCSALVSFNVPAGVETIGSNAFYECRALASVTIPQSVIEIGANAFSNTALPFNENGLCYAGNWIVGYTGEFTQVKFNEGTYGIANGALAGSKIVTLDIPDSVVYIGDNAFQNCKSLTMFDAGNGVKRIGRYAFANCDILGRGHVSFGTNVEQIASYAFYNCKDLGNPSYLASNPITISKTVKNIGVYAFRNTGFWSSTETNGGVVYVDNWAVGYVDNENAPDVTVRNGTVGLADYAFYKSTTMETVSLPESIVTLGTNAFNSCSRLVRVFINDWSELEEIGDYTFYKCGALYEIDIPVTVRKIGRSALYKSGVVTVTLPDTVEEIGDYAFYGCGELVSFFANKTHSSLKTIGNYAFASCGKITQIDLPDAVDRIGNYAFSKCSLLDNVTFGNGLKTIGESAFNACTSLKEVQIPASVTQLGRRAFYKCSSLAKVTLNEGLETIGDYVFYGNALTEVELPSTVKSIGDYAFRNCNLLRAVILPSHVETIGSHAFNGCKFLTLYVENAERVEGWNARWNSGYRPVIWGCTISEEGYVVSFVKGENGIENSTAKNGLSAPERSGYVFEGWRAEIEGEAKIFTMEELADVPAGTLLTAVWKEAPAQLPEEK